jgi:serine phosphatase RsbU (regulator of sigma subunit)/PAS domain-containing protein
MTAAPPSATADAPLAGVRGWSVRSVLAPAPLSRGAIAGAAGALALGVLEAAITHEVLIAALLVLPPLVVALTGRWGDTAVVAALGLAIVLTSPLWYGDMGAPDLLVPLLLVPAGGAVAIVVAVARTGTAVSLERFRLLVGVDDAADRATADEFVQALRALLVPAFADELQVALSERPGGGPPQGPSLAGAALDVPLRARGLVFGLLSCAVGASGRRYSEADRRFAEVLAGRVALALDNAGLTSELAVAEKQLGAVVRTLAEAVTVTDATGRVVYANDAAVALLRVDSLDYLLSAEPGEIMNRFAVFREDGRPVELADLPGARVLAGESGVEPMLVRNVVRATGEERWLLNKISTLRDREERILRVVNVIEDVTGVKRAERSQRLLAQASEALAASLDYEETLQRVADVAVPALADWVGVDMPGRGGRIDQVASAHTGPEQAAPRRGLYEESLPAVLRDGRTERRGSVMIVPLQAGSKSLGALTFVNSRSLRAFGDDELALAQELGRRAGVAVLNARMYSRRTAIAQALQHGLLPPELPEVPGWSSAVLYRPAGELNEVGGDFYDVFEGPDSWMLVIGDIAGQGAEAATRTSLARFTVRTAAELTGDVSRAVLQLNETLRGQAGLPLCTVVCARLSERGDGTALLTVAIAGHPPPLLVRGREVVPIGDPGTIAGAFDGERWPAASIELVPGDVLVFYTDGVLDAVGESDRFGERRLREALSGLDGSVRERLAGLHAALEAFQRGPQRDDTTVLVLEYRGDGAAAAARVEAGEAAR